MFALKLKVSMRPVSPVWNWRQDVSLGLSAKQLLMCLVTTVRMVSTHAFSLVHSNWVTLISHMRWKAMLAAAKVKASMAVSPSWAPISTYTGIMNATCTHM